jgi:predicted aldo/keto reductase-like oxidoreductase
MDFSNIKVLNHPMEYRRFGKTNKKVSVITLGGMRFKHGFKEPRNIIPAETLQEGIEVTQTAFEHGINLIETAYGYKKSETLYGIVLNEKLKKPRHSYYLMTKGNPKTARETRSQVAEQLKALQTDYLDFYAWHGINTNELCDEACAPGGSVEELLKMKEEGIIGHVGFSTHAPVDVIIKAINTDLFEFVNLHYYYFFQRNKAAIDIAETKDMGVFIISPNDKGGQLYNPPQKLVNLTAPLHPVQWNARFCLGHPAIHTLTFGFPKTSRFDLLDDIFPARAPMAPNDARIQHLMDEQNLLDPYAGFDGYCMQNDPSGLNIPEILRFRRMWKCFDMKDFGLYRYNMFEEKGHWFPGTYPTDDKLDKIDMTRCPENVPLTDLIKETHNALYKPKLKNIENNIVESVV